MPRIKLLWVLIGLALAFFYFKMMKSSGKAA
jgi:hypothetical protein